MEGTMPRTCQTFKESLKSPNIRADMVQQLLHRTRVCWLSCWNITLRITYTLLILVPKLSDIDSLYPN